MKKKNYQKVTKTTNLMHKYCLIGLSGASSDLKTV